MVKGKYFRTYATSCCLSDRRLFRRMKTEIIDSPGILVRPDIWVRRVKLGDIITSQTQIIRWKFVESEGKLYLGFIEWKSANEEYKHNRVSMYVVKQNVCGGSDQKYFLARVKTSNVHELLW